MPAVVVQDVIELSDTGYKLNGAAEVAFSNTNAVVKFASNVITYKIGGLTAGASYKVSIVGQDATTGASSQKPITVTQKTEPLANKKAPGKLGALKGTKPTINSVQLTWEAPVVTGTISRYVIQVWEPQAKPNVARLVQEITMTVAEYNTAKVATDGYKITGLLAGTNYTFAVKAVDAENKDLTPYAVKAVKTAAYPAVKVDVKKNTLSMPAKLDSAIGISAANYTTYELVWMKPADKTAGTPLTAVSLGIFTLSDMTNVKDKGVITGIDGLLKSGLSKKPSNYGSLLTAIKGLAKSNFVLRAVTLSGDLLANGSAEAKFTLTSAQVVDWLPAS
jgi:hypothetical protein